MNAGVSRPTKFYQTSNTIYIYRESDYERYVPWSKGKQPKSTSKVPKFMLSGKGCAIAKTTRMLAQKQPYIKRVRNSSLVEW